MNASSGHPAVLPVMRPDIEFHLGPDDPDGAPTYVLHDPLRGTFDRATWVQATILELLRLPLTFHQLLDRLSATTTINVTQEDVTRLCADASNRGLTEDSCVAIAPPSDARQDRRGRLPIELWLRKLMYVRIPLWEPDAFLTRTIDVVRHLAGPTACFVYLVISVTGLILLTQRFEAYCSTFPFFLHVRGLGIGRASCRESV